MALFPRQRRVDADEVLPLVAAEGENFKAAVRLAFGLQLPLHADKTFARGVDGEAAEVAADPLAPELLGDRHRGAGAAEEVSDEVAFVGGTANDPIQ